MERNSNGKENATHSLSSRKNTIDRHKKNKNWDLQHLDRYHNIVRAFKPHTHTHTEEDKFKARRKTGRAGRNTITWAPLQLLPSPVDMVREFLATRAKTQNPATTEAPPQPKHCRTQFSTVKLVRESGLCAHSDMIYNRAEKENRVFSFVNELGFLKSATGFVQIYSKRS